MPSQVSKPVSRTQVHSHHDLRQLVTQARAITATAYELRCAPGVGHDAERAHVVAAARDAHRRRGGALRAHGRHVSVRLLQAELHVHGSGGAAAVHGA